MNLRSDRSHVNGPGRARSLDLSGYGSSKEVDRTSIRGRSPPRIERKPRVAFFIALMLLSINLIYPTLAQDGPKVRTSGADYGIFENISELVKEQETRVDDKDVVSKVDSTLGSVSLDEYSFQEDLEGDLVKEELDFPQPITQSPVVFDALMGNPIIDDTRILDWIMPPPLGDQGSMNYLVLATDGEHLKWELGSMVPRLGLVTDSSLDKWVYVDVDNNTRTGDAQGNDIRARMTFARDLLARDWDVSLIPPSIQFRNAGLRIEVEATEYVNGMADMGGSVYFIKGISYSGKNYIWSIGIGLQHFMDSLELKLQAREWRSEPTIGLIQALLGGGTIDPREMKLLELLGPYTISYEFGTAPDEMDIFVSVMRLENTTLRDMAYLNVGFFKDRFHDDMLGSGRIILNVKNNTSPIEGLQWKAGMGNSSSGSDTQGLRLRYVEFSEDLIDASITIPVLPNLLSIEMAYYEVQGREVTALDLETPIGLSSLEFLEVIYSKWYDDGALSEWNATQVKLEGIPSSVHLETTTNVPLELGEQSSINLLDSFMSQFASRFYRLGRVLREIPRSFSELPSRKGFTTIDCHGDAILQVEFHSTSDVILNGTGDWAAFDTGPSGEPVISARINGVSYYRGSFTEGNDITLELLDVSLFRIYALSDIGSAVIDIEEPPERIHVFASGDRITYEGEDQEGPGNLKALRYRYRDNDLFFDANMIDLPPSMTIDRSDESIEVTSSGGDIGSLELFSSNSSNIMPPDMKERNYASVLIEDGEVAVGLRLNRLRALRYNNGSEGFIEMETVSEANLYLFIEDRDMELDLLAAFIPLPPFTHIDLPSVIDTPELNIPDLLGIESIDQYSDLLLSLSTLGRAPLSMGSGLSRGLIEAIGRYSTDLSLSWDLSEKDSTLDLIIDLEKSGTEEIAEPHWTHGIWVEHAGLGSNSSMSGRIYLEGMPTRGNMSLSFSQETVYAKLDFKGYEPGFDWLLIHTSGVQDRDISIYMTGLSQRMDLTAEINVTTDLDIGGRMVIDLNVTVRDCNGNPLDLGPMLGALRKSSPILSVRQMYLPKVTSELDLSANIGNGVRAEYRASDDIDYLYFKIIKYLQERWSQIYAIFHDLPTRFQVSIDPTHEFSMEEPLPLQGLPVIDISTSSNELDMYVEYDGSGFGQRGKYKIYADDLGDTRSYYDEGSYIVDSDGIGFLSLEIGRLPVLESFTLDSLILLGNGIRHLRLSARMTYGIYPIIELKDSEGESFQIQFSGTLKMEDETYDPDMFFITLRTTDVLGMDIVTGFSVSKDTSAVDMEGNDGAKIMPAPLLTFWYWALGPIFGGG